MSQRGALFAYLWIFFKVVSKLLFKKTMSGSAFKEFFSSESILFMAVGFVVDKLERTSKTRGDIFVSIVFR